MKRIVALAIGSCLFLCTCACSNSNLQTDTIVTPIMPSVDSSETSTVAYIDQVYRIKRDSEIDHLDGLMEDINTFHIISQMQQEMEAIRVHPTSNRATSHNFAISLQKAIARLRSETTQDSSIVKETLALFFAAKNEYVNYNQDQSIDMSLFFTSSGNESNADPSICEIISYYHEYNSKNAIVIISDKVELAFTEITINGNSSTVKVYEKCTIVEAAYPKVEQTIGTFYTFALEYTDGRWLIQECFVDDSFNSVLSEELSQEGKVLPLQAKTSSTVYNEYIIDVDTALASTEQTLDACLVDNLSGNIYEGIHNAVVGDIIQTDFNSDGSFDCSYIVVAVNGQKGTLNENEIFVNSSNTDLACRLLSSIPTIAPTYRTVHADWISY